MGRLFTFCKPKGRRYPETHMYILQEERQSPNRGSYNPDQTSDMERFESYVFDVSQSGCVFVSIMRQSY